MLTRAVPRHRLQFEKINGHSPGASSTAELRHRRQGLVQAAQETGAGPGGWPGAFQGSELGKDPEHQPAGDPWGLGTNGQVALQDCLVHGPPTQSQTRSGGPGSGSHTWPWLCFEGNNKLLTVFKINSR